MSGILDQITVLDLSTGPAAALATMLLGDQGARVIRLLDANAAAFREGGFVVWDRGKECLALDLDLAATEAAEAARFRELVSGADVVVEDFAPSAKRQRLVDGESLRQLNPRLVSCSITAYGKRGPLKDGPPIDELVLARMGVLGGMPGFRPAPVHVVHPLPSVGAALLACLGISAALLARESTGRGRAVETSLMAGALLYHPKVLGERLDRHVFQTHPSGSAPFYSVYQCADGTWVQLGCVHEGFIRAAARLMGIADLIAEPRFQGGRGGATPEDEAELREALARVIAGKPFAAWAAMFEEADVPFAPVRRTEDGLSDPQVIHNGMVTTLQDPALGSVVQMGVPIEFSSTPGQVRGPRQPLSAADAVRLGPVGDAGAQTGSDEPDPPPLAGIRILEITNLIAGPTGGRLLADLGADVIKLEPPGGDLSRPIGRTYFYSLNFNKRSISVDTSVEAGKQVVRRVAATADALLANLRPGATARMGIGPASHPQLIEAHITGYGWSGPYAHRPGIDPLSQALMGMEWAQGGFANAPVFPAQLAPTDYTTGALAAFGIVLALFARRRQGIVQRVDSNLLNGAILLSSAWFTQYAGKPRRPLADREQFGLHPFHRLYRLRDGWIYVVAERDAERRALLRVAGLGDGHTCPLEQSGEGHPNDGPIARALAAAFAERRLEQVQAELARAGVPAAEATAGDSEHFLQDPHALANGMVAGCRHPRVGRLTVAWRYVQFARTRPVEARPTPLLGEQTDAVLHEAGCTDEEVRTLHAADVVKAEIA